MPLISRELAAKLGRETVRILEAGGYTAPSGRSVDLRAALTAAGQGTRGYPPDHQLSSPQAAGVPARISVENATTLEVGRRMAATGPVAALNFASATHPGGGFLVGARAQEESIARSSGLFHCLQGRHMYRYHAAQHDAMNSDYVIYSPDVPVFRRDGGDLLEEPWHLSVLTSPAVYGYALEAHEPGRLPEVRGAMRKRTAKVLAGAAIHGHRRLILGAWGCGAFGLDPEMMAGVFHEQLTVPFSGVFDEIVFAISDGSTDDHFIGPFRRRFS